MSIPHSVADILDHHVTFQLECIDRMYLNVLPQQNLWGDSGSGSRPKL